MINKKINTKLFFLVLALIAFESVLFFCTKPFVTNPYILNTTLDNAMPYISYFVYPYILWYVMLMFVPYFTYTKHKDSFYKYVVAFIIATTISAIIFVVFPNGVIRPEITDNTFTSKLVKILYMLDTPAINCMPSIHCLYAYLFFFSTLDTKENTPKWYKAIILILAILIVLATMFIKQHVLIDAITSLILAIIVWYVTNKFKLYEFVKGKLNKIGI